MNISVIGCGYLGAVHAATLAELGHTVTGYDLNAQRISELSAGSAPFFEPQLDALLASEIAAGRLHFTTDPERISACDLHMLCVGTPAVVGTGAADLTALRAATLTLAAHLRPGAVVVGRSTVPVGTAAELAALLEPRGAELIWNPEFLREGTAVHDARSPDRIVIGRRDTAAGRAAAAQLTRAYASLGDRQTPILETSLETAELAKGAANAFLATKVSFMNMLADLSEVSGANVTDLAQILGADPRIGSEYLRAGLGFGGGCLPKDLHAFMYRAEELGAAAAVGMLREVAELNEARAVTAVRRIAGWFAGDLTGRRIAVLGASFKPDSDDIRDSPALRLAQALLQAGADVTVTDPQALPALRSHSPELPVTAEWEEAAHRAEVLVLATDWQEYRDIDPEVAAALVSVPRIFDGKNALPRDAWTAAGWHYAGVGQN